MGATKCFSFHILRPKKPNPSPEPSVTTNHVSRTSPPLSASQSPASPSELATKIQCSDDIRKVFSKLDTDGNGVISINELESALRAFGDADPEREATSIMRVADSNGDGCIQLDEFVSVMETDETKCMEDLRQAFTVYDRDRNGLISAQELHHVLRTVMGETATLAECKRMIKAVDCNGDGAVSFEEFVTMMSRSIA